MYDYLCEPDWPDEPDVDLMEICKQANLVHPEQDAAVYRLAFAMFQTICICHKECAVHRIFEGHTSNDYPVVPSLISFLRLNTDSEFFGSLTNDAVAMELFQGSSLLGVADSLEAREVFGRMSVVDIQQCLQDVVRLGSYLLPTGFQQADCAARNILIDFDSESGCRTMSMIDLESLHPIQGDI